MARAGEPGEAREWAHEEQRRQFDQRGGPSERPERSAGDGAAEQGQQDHHGQPLDLLGDLVQPPSVIMRTLPVPQVSAAKNTARKP
jgi:hypothetical protein